MSENWIPLKERSLIERAEEFLIDYILSGEVAAGDYLPPEQELGRKLGVGRSTLREAISILQSKGLVERQHGVGLRVIDRSEQAASEMLALMLRRKGTAARDLLEVRRVYEVQAAAWAAERATPEDLRALKEALAAMQAPEVTLDACVQADAQFHRAIAVATQNVVLVWIADTTRELVLDAMRTTMQSDFRPERVYCSHLPILEAIQHRDATAAARAMEEHLRLIEHRLRRVLESESPEPPSTRL